MDSIRFPLCLYSQLLQCENDSVVSSPKIAATWGQSRRVALLSQFFHHFLQLGWEWPVLPDVFKLQTPVNHWTIELDKWINLASWCILSLSHEITNHSDTAQKVPSKLPALQWGNTIFNLALMCYSVWLGTASLHGIHDKNPGISPSICFTCWWNMGPTRRLVMQKARRGVIGFPRAHEMAIK